MADKKLMDTEPGGEQTQYERLSTFTEPPDKQHGQLGDPSEQGSSNQEAASGPSVERGEKTADDMRYGQQVSESGVGGYTNTATGEANQEGGYGGVQAQSDLGDARGEAGGRTEQGYSAKDDVHDHKVGG